MFKALHSYARILETIILTGNSAPSLDCETLVTTFIVRTHNKLLARHFYFLLEYRYYESLTTVWNVVHLSASGERRSDLSR